MKRRLLVVPARKGSKRIKNKNFLNFYGKPIIEYGLNVALKSRLFNTIHVSSNDPKISVKYNLEKKNSFVRPQNLSTDKTPLTRVLKYVLNNYEKLGEKYDEIWMMLPCSPLIDKEIFFKANNLMMKKNCNAFTTVGKSRVPFYWYYRIKNNKLTPFFKNHTNKPSQSLPNTYFEVGILAGWKIKYFKKCLRYNKSFNFMPVILSFFQSFDVDTYDDLNIIKTMYKHRLNKNVKKNK